MIVSDNGPDFELAPAGTHRAVCVDVVDMGIQETPYGKKHKMRIVWEINENMSDGRPFVVMGFYTASLNEKANLRADLEAWRGRPFTQDELAGFNLENLLGVSCLLSVVHNESNKKTYANVATVAPLMKDMEPLAASGEYTRVKDRGTEDAPANGDVPSQGAINDADIPF